MRFPEPAAANPFQDEEFGSTTGEVLISGPEATAAVEFGQSAPSLRELKNRLNTHGSPNQRMYLAIDDIRGEWDAHVLNVVLHLPGRMADVPAASHVAGSLALYGLRRATNPLAESRGRGLSFNLDVTPFFAELAPQSNASPDQILVTLQSHPPLSEGHSVVVARIRIFLRSFSAGR